MPDFETDFSPDTLRTTYQGYLQGKHDVYDDRPKVPVGINGMTRRAFEHQLDLHLASMSRQTLSGRFRFAPFLEHEIPKPGSEETRTIATATIRDAVVQKALYRHVYEAVDAQLGGGVHGYRDRRSAHSAVRAIREAFAERRVFVFDADIRKFFDSIDHTLLRAMVDALQIDGRAKTLLWRFMCAGRQTKEQKRNKQQPSPRRRGVPQGGVLSGMLANLYLTPMDEAITAAGGRLIRYADDFVVCCRSPKECAEIRDVVVRELANLKLELHPDKTRDCVDGREGLDFVGFRISTNAVQIRKANVQRFKARVSSVLNDIEGNRPKSWRRAMFLIAKRVGRKITGPARLYIDRMIERGIISHPHRRCWIGFFRIVTDLDQIRDLDRWVQRQISSLMWRSYQKKITRERMKEFGLPTLLTHLSKARRPTRPSGSRANADDPNRVRIADDPRGNLRNPRRKVPTQGGGPDGDALDGGGQPLT